VIFPILWKLSQNRLFQFSGLPALQVLNLWLHATFIAFLGNLVRFKVECENPRKNKAIAKTAADATAAGFHRRKGPAVFDV